MVIPFTTYHYSLLQLYFKTLPPCRELLCLGYAYVVVCGKWYVVIPFTTIEENDIIREKRWQDTILDMVVNGNTIMVNGYTIMVSGK